MTIGELFAGYGGLGMGVQSVLGGELAWYSEIDKGALKILTHRFPDIPNIGDITAVDWSQVEPVDILTGGSPCQDLSHAGKRSGMTKGTRSNLWVAMREAIAHLRPSLVIWENVRGAYSAAADSEVEPCAGCVGDGPGVHLRALGRVLGDLSDLGYDAIWHGLRAADIGAPHGRFRVFVVADMGEGKTVDAWDEWTDAMQAKHGNGNGHGKSLSLDAQRLPVNLLPTPRTKNNENRQTEGYSGEAGNFYGLLHNPERWGEYAPAIARWEQVLDRPAPEPTQLSSKGNPQLAPAFVEWMMGLPAGWVTDAPGITRNEALKALGNGVVPQQAAAALQFMLANLARAAA